MDIASFVGMFGVVALNLMAMGDPKIFIDITSIILVLGGTCFLILFSFPLPNVIRIGSYCKYAFVPPKLDADEEKVRNDLEMGILFLERAKTYFQASGWIGLLIGLVLIFTHLSGLSDQAAIGPAMTIAMLTVLYGVTIAYLICLPVKTKLQYHLNILNEATLNVD